MNRSFSAEKETWVPKAKPDWSWFTLGPLLLGLIVLTTSLQRKEPPLERIHLHIMGDDEHPDLQELDPFPDDDDSLSEVERGDYIPGDAKDYSSGHTPSYSSSKLGLRGHGLDYWLSSIQKYSTAPPSIFLALHITNTSLIPLATRSVPSSETFLLLTRPVYQSPVFEHLFLTAPILAHITSGLALRYRRRSRRARLYGAETRAQKRELRARRPPNRQARLGYTLIPLLGAHVLVNRVVPLYVDGGSSGVGLGYVAHGIARSPWIASGYYVALVGVGVWHVVGGWAWWMGWRDAMSGRTGRNTGANGGYLGSTAGSESLRRKRRIRWAINGVVLAGTGLWLAGGLGIVGRGGEGSGWEAKNWDAIYAQVPLLGQYIAAPK